MDMDSNSAEDKAMKIVQLLDDAVFKYLEPKLGLAEADKRKNILPKECADDYLGKLRLVLPMLVYKAYEAFNVYVATAGEVAESVASDVRATLNPSVQWPMEVGENVHSNVKPAVPSGWSVAGIVDSAVFRYLRESIPELAEQHQQTLALTAEDEWKVKELYREEKLDDFQQVLIGRIQIVYKSATDSVLVASTAQVTLTEYRRINLGLSTASNEVFPVQGANIFIPTPCPP